uniref:N-acetylated-alpha-linked acidic dipeptidase 2 n=1 Tax=Macrostomum lignano TaxID=282301 RepID=A0A1I8I506_9PLAT
VFKGHSWALIYCQRCLSSRRGQVFVIGFEHKTFSAKNMRAKSYWQTQKQSCSKGRVALIVALCLMVGTIFLIIGFFVRRCDSGGGGGDGEAFARLIREADPSIRDAALGQLSSARIRAHLKAITARPHVATQATDPAKDYVKSHWTKTFQAHKDRVQMVSQVYRVLLSRAKLDGEKTRFEIRSANNSRVDFTSQTVEKPLTEHDNDTDIPSPILAYAPSGDLTGPAVYANYGTEADLQHLTKNLSISLNGSILLTRYGRSGRGAKAVTAAKYGAAGVLIFSDPADVAKNQSAAFPNGQWMPGTGTQKGSAMLSSGDPTTPGYPSLATAYRYDAVARGVCPPLPMYPIGYADAREIIDRLEGAQAPEDWRVRIRGMNLSRPMRLGPKMSGDQQLRLVVNQENFMKDIENVCVKIHGDIEPDRWVIVGNHRDAWGFGAVDPSSGTAVLMEFSEVLANLLATGWKPRRSIMLCTWDGEEHGLIGSWEFVEENLMMLKDVGAISISLKDQGSIESTFLQYKVYSPVYQVYSPSVVAYVNIDIAAAGNYSMRTSAMPSLRDFAKTLMDSLPEEVNPGKSMGQTWSDRWADGKSAMDSMLTPIGGSDYAAFIELASIPAIDIMFRADPKESSLYPMYHVRYESFYYVDTYVDPGFKAHLSSARLLTEVVRQLTDEYLLPYALNMSNTALELEKYFASVNGSSAIGAMPELKAAVTALGDSVTYFQQQTTAWDRQTVDRRSPLGVRRINDAAMRATQSFLASRGQPRQPYVANLVFTSGKHPRRSPVECGSPDCPTC